MLTRFDGRNKKIRFGPDMLCNVELDVCLLIMNRTSPPSESSEGVIGDSAALLGGRMLIG